jgi:hypothetical protein
MDKSVLVNKSHCRYTTTNITLQTGPLRVGSGSSKKMFSHHPPRKGEPTKNIYTKLERLSVAEWLWLGLKGLICKSTNNDTTEKDKNICNIVGPRSPFEALGPGNLYRLPPPVSALMQILSCRYRTKRYHTTDITLQIKLQVSHCR